MALSTEQKIETLKDAIALGALEVWYGDKRIKYRSLNEMKQILSDLQSEAAPAKSTSRVRYPNFNNGCL